MERGMDAMRQQRIINELIKKLAEKYVEDAHKSNHIDD